MAVPNLLLGSFHPEYDMKAKIRTIGIAKINFLFRKHCKVKGKKTGSISICKFTYISIIITVNSQKCFTFGKKVKRQIDDEDENTTRIDLLKRKFQKLGLLRSYFSVGKKRNHRKFKYPVTEDSEQIYGKVFDEL